MKLIFVEGNIGSGKSTYLDFLESKGKIVIREPVAKWQNVNGHNLLNLMYTDTEKYGFMFQTYAFISRMELVLSEIAKRTSNPETEIFCERSIYTDRFVFFESLASQKKISPVEQEVYNSMWDFWKEMMSEKLNDPSLDLTIEFLYIKCDPTLCFTHLQKRNRSEEIGVTLDYLILLDKNHDYLYKSNNHDFYYHSFQRSRLVKIIINDGTESFFKN